jgi:hypothetical protein
MVAAVLLIHRLRNAVATMNAPITASGRRPAQPMIVIATRRCSPECSIARAIRKPPRKRKISGFAYGTATRSNGRTPRSGSAAIGTRAVAARGNASVTHHAAISSAIPAAVQAGAGNPEGGSVSTKPAAPRSPPQNPICRSFNALPFAGN